jgi:hypothetical protein
VLLTFGQGPVRRRLLYTWVYLFKTLVGAWLLWESRPYVAEHALAPKLARLWPLGILICVVWIGLDGLYPRLVAFRRPVWKPGQRICRRIPPRAWFFNLTRLVGSTVVVPPWRRSSIVPFNVPAILCGRTFCTMPLSQFPLHYPFVVTYLHFRHHAVRDRWLAGILCGLAYQGLVVSQEADWATLLVLMRSRTFSWGSGSSGKVIG